MTLAFFYLYSLIHDLQCSTVFTRSMIKMQDRPPSLGPYFSSVDPLSYSQTADERQYELLPIAPNVKSRSMQSNLRMEMANGSDNLEDLSTHRGKFENTFNNDLLQQSALDTIKNKEDLNMESLRNESSTESNSCANSGPDCEKNEISFITKKDIQDLNFWEVFKRFLYCGWTFGWVSCIKETIDNPDSLFPIIRLLLHADTPLDRTADASGDYIGVNDKFDVVNDLRVQGQ